MLPHGLPCDWELPKHVQKVEASYDSAHSRDQSLFLLTPESALTKQG